MPKNKIIWFTGLSGSGKTTLSIALNRYFPSYILDGDIIRKGLCSDLGFTDKDRTENIRRVAEVSKILLESGSNVIGSFISPFDKDRKFVRNTVAPFEFIEVYLKCSVSVCQQRDPKNLYKQSIKNFTGIDSVYEIPVNPEITLDTNINNVEECIFILLDRIIC